MHRYIIERGVPGIGGMSGFPADTITEVVTIIDPTTGVAR